MSKEGKWKEMGDLIDDDVVRTFAAVGDVPTVARELRERWDGRGDPPVVLHARTESTTRCAGSCSPSSVELLS